MKKWEKIKKWLFDGNATLVNELVQLKSDVEYYRQTAVDLRKDRDMWKNKHDKLLEEFKQQYEMAQHNFQQFLEQHAEPRIYEATRK